MAHRELLKPSTSDATRWRNSKIETSKNKRHTVTLKQMNAFGMRNIQIQGLEKHILLDLYFKIVVNDHIIYVSEVFSSTLNPVWMPFQLEEVLENGLYISTGSCFTVLVLQVHEKKAMVNRKKSRSLSAVGGNFPASSYSKTRRKSKSARHGSELFRLQCNVHELDPLPKGLNEFPSLPFNTCLFEFNGRLYVSRETIEVLKDFGLISNKLFRRNSSMIISKYYSFNEGLRNLKKNVELHSSLLEERQKTQKLQHQVLFQLTKKDTSAELEHQYAARKDHIRCLKEHISSYRAIIDSLKQVTSNEVKIIESSIPIPRALLLTMRMNIRCKEEKNGILSRRYDVLRTAFKIRHRQALLVKALQTIYPISSIKTGEYSIRHIKISNSDLTVNGKLEEELLSTALGYLAHVVFMLAKYFNVNLRYHIVPFSSRSYIKDEINDLFGEYPLYKKGVEKERFERAITFLRKDVDQVPYYTSFPSFG